MAWNKNQFKHMGIIRNKMMLDTIVRKVHNRKWNYTINTNGQLESTPMSDIIESLLLGIPIGDMTVIEDYDARGDIILDGNIRIMIVASYMADLFPVESKFVPDSCNSKRFSELPEQYQKLIKKTYVIVNVIQKQASKELKQIAAINMRTNLWEHVSDVK